MIRRAAWVLTWLLLIPAGMAAQEETANVVEHRVRPGETLWSIANAYYDDPHAWRQIFDANQDRVSNPRVIEPGMVLRIPGQPPGTGQARGPAQASGTAEILEVQVTTVPRRFGAPVSPSDGERESDRTIFYSGGGAQRPVDSAMPPAGNSTAVSPRLQDGAVLLTAVPPDVFYTAGWLIPVDSKAPSVGTIVGFAAADGGRIFDRRTAYPFDRLRLEVADGVALKLGDQLMTFRLGREIEYVGRVVLPTGIVTITERDPSGVVAVLADEYGQVTLGDRVIVLPHYPLVAGVSAEPVASERVGRILAFQDSHLVQSLGAIAYLDFGSDSGIRVGDEFVIHVGEREGSEGDPIGRLQVVGVHEDHVAARIIHVSSPLIVAGLRVRLAAKMP